MLTHFSSNEIIFKEQLEQTTKFIVVITQKIVEIKPSISKIDWQHRPQVSPFAFRSTTSIPEKLAETIAQQLCDKYKLDSELFCIIKVNGTEQANFFITNGLSLAKQFSLNPLNNPTATSVVNNKIVSAQQNNTQPVNTSASDIKQKDQAAKTMASINQKIHEIAPNIAMLNWQQVPQIKPNAFISMQTFPPQFVMAITQQICQKYKLNTQLFCMLVNKNTQQANFLITDAVALAAELNINLQNNVASTESTQKTYLANKQNSSTVPSPLPTAVSTVEQHKSSTEETNLNSSEVNSEDEDTLTFEIHRNAENGITFHTPVEDTAVISKTITSSGETLQTGQSFFYPQQKVQNEKKSVPHSNTLNNTKEF